MTVSYFVGFVAPANGTFSNCDTFNYGPNNTPQTLSGPRPYRWAVGLAEGASFKYVKVVGPSWE
jgi:hypothetical protein